MDKPDYDILFRYFKGEATGNEEEMIAGWLQESQENREEFRNARFMFTGMALYAADSRKSAGAKRMKRPGRTIRLISGIAASLILLAGIGYLSYRYGVTTVSDELNVVEVPAGQRLRLTLNDGTVVWLNSGARLEYPVAFSHRSRKVELSGEAFFKVSRDASRPFSVRTFASDIRVIGTEFNVDADEKFNRFSVALLEGSVAVSNRISPEEGSIVLRPDDILNLENGKFIIGHLEDESSLCWKEGLIYVNGLTFPELMAKFEQAFDVTIDIQCDTMPDIGSLGGKIRVSDGIEKALNSLRFAADFTFETDSEHNIITIH